MAKIGARRRRVYEDRGARISILAGRRPPRPDTLNQTDQPPISTKPLADGAAHTFSTISAHSGHRIGSRRELFTALLFARLYRRRIKLYRGIHLRRAVPSFTVELRHGRGWRPTQVKIRVCLRRRSSKRHLSEGHIVSQLRHSRPTRQRHRPMSRRRSQRVESFSVLSLTRLPAVSPEKSCSHPHRI